MRTRPACPWKSFSPWTATALAAVAVVAIAIGCGSVMRAAGYPPEARRKAPPTTIETTAAKVGDRAPKTALAMTGGTWRLADALSTGPAILVFYRGHW